ncbi:hypothetical protein GGH19_004918 [Coemansia sp. RSA 1807]|nr:hypothetical protein GGH15_000275 [Coemansia sp. RSA 562]KAJ2215148.1 hypothetical protein EV180_006081 [Coemansia sp. RSA 518]KAJ2294467.1 hypothetical protein IW141_000308 [Coemansia sp. RSA 355]KAJ2410766.1 hypothetical protein J3F80_000267 [Coemansia sp. RSA 2526]KAJ2571493.1 hypothetical protein GGH19_004918 [Coemansia sp. RSA 1807]
MSAMVRLRSGPKRQTELGDKAIVAKKAKTKAAKAVATKDVDEVSKPVLRGRRAETNGAARAVKPKAPKKAVPKTVKPTAKTKPSSPTPSSVKPTRKRKLESVDGSASFIMSSPKRKARSALSRLNTDQNPPLHSPRPQRTQTEREHTPERTTSASSASGTPRSTSETASPFKTIVLNPMNNLWRRMSGFVQGSTETNRPPMLNISEPRLPSESVEEAMPGAFTSGSTDEAGAPIESAEANSLTAPPMNPPMGHDAVCDSASTSPTNLVYPETPSKENIPTDSYTQPSVTTITPMTLPGLDSDQLMAIDMDSDFDASLDSDPDSYSYFPFDDDDEFSPYLFMANLPPIPREHTLRPYALPRKTRSSPPITLVLDLDETLVHCALTKVENADMVFPVEYNNVKYSVYCRLRPGYREFLERASALFEVVVFTASQQVYADQLLNLIDPGRRHIRHRLFRDSCVYVNTNYVKDLGILGRDESKMMLVDNCPQAFAYQQSNGIPIESWYEDKADCELMRLMEFLERLVGVDDVRPMIDAEFKTKEKISDAVRRSQKRNMSQMYIQGV